MLHTAQTAHTLQSEQRPHIKHCLLLLQGRSVLSARLDDKELSSAATGSIAKQLQDMPGIGFSEARILILGRQQLPQQLPQLHRLLYLDLSGNQLKTLPDAVCQLATLQSSRLRGCKQLERLPRALSRLSALQMLDISECTSLVRLPDPVCELTALQHLNCWGCGQLGALPQDLGQLPS
jgi:Leucine-rich repeat (LRR) protein